MVTRKTLKALTPKMTATLRTAAAELDMLIAVARGWQGDSVLEEV